MPTEWCALRLQRSPSEHDPHFYAYSIAVALECSPRPQLIGVQNTRQIDATQQTSPLATIAEQQPRPQRIQRPQYRDCTADRHICHWLCGLTRQTFRSVCPESGKCESMRKNI